MAPYRETGNNDEFLKDLRQAYSDDETDWRPVREEGRTDIRMLSGDGWDLAERLRREKNQRLCLTFDELSQYTNQVINESRQNKRAIKVTANGNGANDKEAELRANRIRQIEYRSNAQQAYTTMFENTVNRGYGWLRIITRHVNKSRNEQELLIQAIPNPDMVTPGPHVMPDGSDITRLWFHEWYSQKEFRRKYPQAKIKDFNSQMLTDLTPTWLQSDKVMVAEYWVKESKEDQDDTVCQYITNGVEVLKKTEWAGKDIPFVPCYGPILFVNVDGRTERRVLSLIRRARQPFMAYCYVRTLEVEMIAQLPKVPWMVREGSLSDDQLKELERSVSEPVAVVQVRSMLPEGRGDFVPEFPERTPINFQDLAGLEAIAEAKRRAIQAAMAQTMLPTSAQRRNEKSGVALKQIEDSGQRGSYHFIAGLEMAITRCGLINNDLLGPIHDTPRDMTIRKPDDSTQVVRVNDPTWVNPDTKQPEHLQFGDGDFDVTISTGPKNDSEREAQSDFADLIVGSPQLAQIIGPEKMAQILAKVIKLKNVGPLGDAMAEIIDPSQQEGKDDPRQMKQQIAKATQMVDMLQKELEQRVKQIETDEVKMQGQAQLQRMKSDLEILLQQMKDATAIRLAELAAEAKGVQIALQHEADHEKQALGHAVDMSEAETARQHEAAMGAMQGDQKLEQGDQGHQQALQQGDQAHQQQLEQGAMSHEQALEQGAQAAALAPQPEAGA